MNYKQELEKAKVDYEEKLTRFVELRRQLINEKSAHKTEQLQVSV